MSCNGDCNCNCKKEETKNKEFTVSSSSTFIIDPDYLPVYDDNNISYKYAEDKIIADFRDYIDSTYGEHYMTEDQSLECFDAWIALGDSTPTFRNTALKYLWRYGKKNGSNKKDLLKTLHYVLMCLYVDHYRNK